jgi:cell division protein FtsQ
MHQLIDKKIRIVFYLFLFSVLTTISSYSNNPFFSDSILKISKIEVSGLGTQDNQTIKKNLLKSTKKNIFFIKKKELQKILNKYDLIETYKIKKIYPNEIEVEIKKIEFFGITKKFGKLFFIGSNGKIIPFKNNSNENLDLPYVYGIDSNKNFISFLNLLKTEKFPYEKIISYYYFPSNRWDIRIKNDILIKLPNKNLPNTLKIIPKIISNNNFDTKIVDLRIANQLIITDE